jgi:serine/threonine-protein kinase
VSVRYAQPGYLVYNDMNRILARPFDLRRRTVGTPPITIAEGPVQRPLGLALGGSTLAYATLGGGNGTLVVIADREGNHGLPNLPPGDYNSPTVSPDGMRISVLKVTPSLGTDMWVYQMPSGPLQQVTHTGDAQGRTWLGDGERIAYTRTGKLGDVFWRRADGSGDEHLLFHRDGMQTFSLFADGQRLVYTTQDGLVRMGWISTPDRDTTISVGARNLPAVSPDGRWLAYGAGSGGPQVYVQPIAGAGARVQVSVRNGVVPRWSRDGRKLYFLDGADLMEATLEFGPGVRVTSLVRVPFYDQTGATLDIFPDGNRIVMTRTADDSGIRPGEITVISNFDMLLKQLARTAR